MNFFVTLSFFLQLSLVVNADDSVTELTSENFQSFVDKKDLHTLVMFYAPWCGHCQEAKPHFLKVAKDVAKTSDKRMVLVNCDEPKNGKLCQKESIEGFPTIKLYHGGKFVEEYVDENSEESFKKYMEKPPKEGEGRPATENQQTAPDTLMPNVITLVSKNFTKISDYDKTLVFFYAPWCPHCVAAKPKYSAAAALVTKQSDAKWALAAVNCDAAENEELCTKEKVEGFPTIRYYKKGEAWAEYEDEFGEEQFVDYLTKNAPEKRQNIVPLSEKYKNESESDHEAEKLKSNEAEAAVNWKKVVFVKGEKDFKAAVGVHRSLVMFYAPWCPHCKSMKPHYIDASELIDKTRPGIKMAVVNCEDKKNEKLCEEQKVSGYPTVILYSFSDKIDEYAPTEQNPSAFVKYLESQPKPAKDEL